MLTVKEILDLKTPLLFDGAIGTVLYNKGLFINRCFEMANVENQDLVSEIDIGIAVIAELSDLEGWNQCVTKFENSTLATTPVNNDKEAS